jgi:hypothetical protein
MASSSLYSSTLYVKDPTPLPRPEHRSEGLTAFLRSLAVGESGVIPRRRTNDIPQISKTLKRVFVTRALDGERSRVWRAR